MRTVPDHRCGQPYQESIVFYYRLSNYRRAQPDAYPSRPVGPPQNLIGIQSLGADIDIIPAFLTARTCIAGIARPIHAERSA